MHPCKSAFAHLLLHDEVDDVEVGLSLSAALDLDETAVFELRDGPADGRDVRAHVLGEALLAGEAQIVVPGVAEEERVGGLGIGRKIRISQNEIRELREAVQRDWIGAIQPHVLLDFLEIAGDVLHLGIVARLLPYPPVINSGIALVPQACGCLSRLPDASD